MKTNSARDKAAASVCSRFEVEEASNNLHTMINEEIKHDLC